MPFLLRFPATDVGHCLGHSVRAVAQVAKTELPVSGWPITPTDRAYPVQVRCSIHGSITTAGSRIRRPGVEGQPMGWRRVDREPAKTAIVTARRAGRTLARAAAEAGVHIATVCRWQADDETFAHSLRQAVEKVTADRIALRVGEIDALLAARKVKRRPFRHKPTVPVQPEALLRPVVRHIRQVDQKSVRLRRSPGLPFRPTPVPR